MKTAAVQAAIADVARLCSIFGGGGLQLASLPSGLMDDLLTLDYAACHDVSLTAIDLDAKALDAALRNHSERHTTVAMACEKRDAWQLGCHGHWDLITSNAV